MWPVGTDKDNLFDEQKYFIMYLMGTIPKLEDWSVQVDYLSQIKEVRNYTLKDLIIEDAEIDVAKLQGLNINEFKMKRLAEEKEKRINEIKAKFGIKEAVKPESIEGLPDTKDIDPNAKRQELWDLLECKGIVKKNG
jgi:hypothetical protein